MLDMSRVILNLVHFSLLEPHTVTCTATADNGNTGTASFSVTIEETPGPVLTVPPNQTYVTNNATEIGMGGANYYFTQYNVCDGCPIVTAIDSSGMNIPYIDMLSSIGYPDADSRPHFLCDPPSGTFFSFGTTTVTCTATDDIGKTGTASFDVTITDESSIDVTPPVITSENIYIQTTDPVGKDVSFATPASTDNVGIVTVSCNPHSGSFFDTGNTNVICTATDAAGNVGVSTFVVSVTYALTDETSPSFTPVSSQSISITNSTGAAFSYQLPAVTDNIGVTIGPTCIPPSGDLFPVGNTVVTCTASDAAGNSGTISFTVSVVNTEATGDTIAPSLTTVEDILVEAIVANGAEIEFDIPTATDNEAVTVGPECTPEPGYFFPIGDTIVTCIAKDEAGNQGTSTFTVSVESRIQIPDEVPTDEIPELSVSTLDSITVEGDTVSSIEAGDLGYFETSLVTNSTSSVLVTVSVMSADQTTLGVGFFKSVIGTGQSDIVLGFQVPKDTVSGIADVYVNVFTDWPELGGVLITDETNTQVDIIGIEFEETSELVESPEDELAKMCGEGTHLEDGICVIDEAVKMELQLESVNIKNASPVLGSNATITIIQFGEYQDESSSDWFFNTRPNLIKNFVETEKANLVFVDMPFLGNDSPIASQAAYCADDQDMYWSYHFMLFNMQKEIDDGWADRESLNSYAFNLGLDLDEFRECMDSGKYQDRVQSNYDEGVTQGVISTPTFLIIFSDGTVEKIVGAQPYSTFANVLESESQETTTVETPAPVVAIAPIITVPPNQTYVTNNATEIGMGGANYYYGMTTERQGYSSSVYNYGSVSAFYEGDLVFLPDAGYVSCNPQPGSFFSSGTTTVTCTATDADGNTGTASFDVTIILEETVEPELESSGIQATIQNAPGSSMPGCEETNSCFLPSKVKIDLGGTVTWENNDLAAHTTTSFKGSISGITGLEWDSGLMTAGQSFSHTFDTAETYDYFCRVHPWMQGAIVVEEVEVDIAPEPEPEPNIVDIDVLELAINDNNTFLNGTDSVRIQKESLNVENDKITISGWIKPDFSENTLQLAAVSKTNSFELFVTNQKEPKNRVGFSVYNGETWNTILGDSIVSERWHHIAGIVNMSEFFIFLDGQLEGSGTLNTVLGLDERGKLVQKSSTINAPNEDMLIGSFEILPAGSNPVLTNNFSGTIFDVIIYQRYT